MQFWSDIRGNFAMIFALVLPAIMVCMGLAVDYGVWIHQKQQLQRIADDASLAAAGQLYMANASKSQAESVASAVAKSSAAAMSMAPASASSSGGGSGSSAKGKGGSDGGSTGSGSRATTFGGKVRVSTKVNFDESFVQVTVRQTGESYFSGMFFAPPELAVTSVARAVGGGRICVLALEPTEAAAVNIQHDSILLAENCGVLSNSTNEKGIAKGTSATIEAELICSAGGYDGSKTGTDPDPVTDCPQINDPLAHTPAPEVGSCDYKNVRHNVFKPIDVTLQPGVYCGGISLTGPVKAWMEPGIYVMKDGPLVTSLWAELKGENVGIFFTGDKATFHFSIEGVVNLTAPKEGPMAGILFFEDRNSKPLRRFEIYSDDARVLLGTIYLPQGRFIVGTMTPIADQSAYTAIVARRIELFSRPKLVLNADYGATDIPVPSGINQVGRNIVLAK